MRWQGIVAFGGMLAAPAIAQAGCPNSCELGEATFTLEPELACARVEATSSGCDCGITLRVANECELALDALSFEFRSCGPSGGPFAFDCGEVPPGEQGTLEQPIHALGRNEFRFTLRHDGADHVIMAVADVSSFDDGAICSVTRGAGRTRALAWAWMLAPLAALAWLRRTRRR